MWETILIEPLYNSLVWLVANIPGASVAVAVIILTLVVKLVLAPLSYQATKAQIAQKKLQPEIKRIREEYPDKQEQSKKMMELYREHKTNPFSGCLVLLIQLPIIYALYKVFLWGFELNPDLLYSALEFPEHINTAFLGIDITEESWIFAILAGVTQFLQLHFSPTLRKTKEEKEHDEKTKNDKKDFATQLGSNMQKQMKYMMPILIVVVAWNLPAVMALYWIVVSGFTIVQELLIQRRLARKETT